MVDPVTTIAGAISIARQLVDIASLAKDAPAKLLIADLQIQLADLKIKISDLMTENHELKTKLSSATSTEKEVVLRGDLYYKPDGDGPFCTACYDTKKQLIRVPKQNTNFQLISKYRCNVCHGHFNGD